MATPVTKKSGLCRYFIRYGDCFHGDKCQFTHALPPQSSTPQQPSTPIMMEQQQQQPPSTPLNNHYHNHTNSTPQIGSQQPQLHPLQQQQQQQHQLYQQQQMQMHQQQQQQQQQGIAMNKLICSLRSDLPNEIDFAMQVAIIIANTDNFTWRHDYPLVDAICSSLHVYSCLCEDSANCYCYARFWHKILVKQASNPYLQAATVPPDMDKSFMAFENLKNHDARDHAKVYKRIKMAAELIKQFSMTTGVTKEEKGHHLKASPPLLKFVSLLLHCDDMPFNLIGLDILANTASKLAKVFDSTHDPTHLKLVQMFEDYCINSIKGYDDIYIVNRSMEVVSKLLSSSSRRVSSSVADKIVENDIVFRIEQLLTSHHDVTLFLATLECCYQMSRHRAHLLTSGKYLVKILLNLLTCHDKKYFRPEALNRVKVVDEDEEDEEEQQQQQLQQLKRKKQEEQNQEQEDPVKQSPMTTTSVRIMTNHSAPTNVVLTDSQAPVNQIVCQWDNCGTLFTEAKDVYLHVYTQHIDPLDKEAQVSCLWSSPNGTGPGCLMRRPKYSLLTHLSDFHCSQAALNRPIAVKPPEHPGYAPNAALLAIKRHANSQKDRSLINQTQSPLSTSVRITAALILRNLASESTEVEQALKDREPLLSEICMIQGRDESKILAECLGSFSKE